MNKPITYKDSGVDIEKGDALVEHIKTRVKSTYGDRVVSGVGGFACLYDIGDKLLAAGTDGVGTKLKIAQKLNNHKSIGIDLVAMCINDIICTGARPLFFMDYLASGKLDLEVSRDIIDGVVDGCLQSEAALIGGETAEMPGMYNDGEYDLAGFGIGEVSKESVLDGGQIKEGDTLFGMASSGFHSNGYSLLRKIVDENDTQMLTALLEPTRIYWKALRPLLEKNLLTGLSHITGGGFLNIARINEKFDYIIDDFAFEKEREGFMNDIFALSKLDDSELYKTFNMGVGMVVSTSMPEALLKECSNIGFPLWKLGKVNVGKGDVILQRNSEKLIL